MDYAALEHYLLLMRRKGLLIGLFIVYGAFSKIGLQNLLDYFFSCFLHCASEIRRDGDGRHFVEKDNSEPYISGTIRDI